MLLKVEYRSKVEVFDRISFHYVVQSMVYRVNHCDFSNEALIC